uniref:Zinc finger, AN1-type domain 1 n=1 Tax=Cyprinodon variegatus TaxID=28743 RepID=A0A3Q2CJP7_CYPVA
MAELDIGKHCQVDTCNLKGLLRFYLEESKWTGGSTSYPCSFEDCKGKELLPVLCPHCEKHFCLISEFLVIAFLFLESKDGSKSKGRRGAKNAATAAKVALMKLKLHAAGDKGLPQTERTYLQVYLPKESKDRSRPMFFSSKWTVGKMVDYAASLAGLKNNNNVLTAKKLRLCHPESGQALQMGDSLQSLLANPEAPLYNGGNVILEYLDNDSTGLEDVSHYIIQS